MWVRKVQFQYVFVAPSGPQLKLIGKLLDAHKIKLPIIEEMPLSLAVEDLTKVRTGHNAGKMVLKVS